MPVVSSLMCALALAAPGQSLEEVASWTFRETRGAGPNLAPLSASDLRARTKPGWSGWIEVGGQSQTGESLSNEVTVESGIGAFTGSNLSQGRPDGMSLVIQAAGGASPDQNNLLINNGRVVWIHLRAPEGEALNLSALHLDMRSTATGFREVKFSVSSDVDAERPLLTIDPYHQTPDGRISWTSYEIPLPELSPAATQATIRIEFHGARSGSGNTRLDQITLRRKPSA